MHQRRRRLRANVRYLIALLTRFKVTFVLAALLLLIVPLLYAGLYVADDGTRITYGAAVHHVYFLLFGQPSLPYVGIWYIEVLNLLIPPVGIAVVVDGVVRFGYLFLAKHRSDKEWIEVVTSTYSDHVVVCGAGRVGYRVTVQLRRLQRDVVVVEKREDAAFVAVLRDLNIPVLIDDIKSPQTLKRTNCSKASAIVCATNDDLANLNVALDARRHNPDIRVVIRLFDDDLVAKVKETFRAEALSSSALAAPAMALTALDPRIVHSFEVGGYLMVVSRFIARHGLPELDVGEVRDRFGGLTLAIKAHDGAEELHPAGERRILNEEVLTIQCQYDEYLRLREFTGEADPPLYGA